ncbi:MAG TPA: cytochrome c [Solirubrobacteraceae bacterium]|jgi:mono/diheme cytochrome c family protein
MFIWVILAFWIVIGLGVFFVAFRGGRARSGARGAAGGDTRASRRSVAIGSVIVWAVFGLGLPALVLATNGGDHKSKQAPGGVDLSSAEVNGRTLFARYCATCHTLRAVNAVGRVGPNLDQLRPPKELVVNAIETGRARGNGQMPADLVAGQDAKDVAAFVAAVAGR